LSCPRSATDSSEDFHSLHASGEASGVSLSIGRRIGEWRDMLAGRLVRLGVTPNGLTIVGFVFSLTGRGFLALSAGAVLPIDRLAPPEVPRSWLPIIAMTWYVLSAACDMLDGAVARLGNLHSKFGAVLDSSLDRASDTAVWCACVLYFARWGNVTYCLLAILALSNAYMISYVKARAEDIIPDCTVGYWQRGERTLAVLVGALSGHMRILLWQQALLPSLTALRRLMYTGAYLRAESAGLPPPRTGVPPGFRKWVMLWRHPRGSIGYDIAAAFNIAAVVFGPVLIRWFYRDADPVGAFLRRYLTP
jgi:CDP-diacylglycerol--glycerol-3-phosphate 3-phosphatidyltransferase